MKRYSLILACIMMIISFNMNAQTKSQKENDEFVKKAASGGMMEVELGNLAQQKGSSQLVKDFGKLMVKDHSDANKKLQSVAKKAMITVPTTMEDKERDKMDKLNNKTGKEFDEDYIEMMVKDHKDDISDFEKGAKNVTNTDLKNWINTTLPVLRKHLASVESIQKQLKNQK